MDSNSTTIFILAAASGLTRFSATERHALLYRYSASCDAIFSTAAPPPFVCGRYGYGFGKIHGSYDSLVLGMRLALKNNHSLTAGVEYSVQLDIGDNDYSQTNIGFRLGYEF